MINYIAADTLITTKENRNFGIINFGDDNKYPNYSAIIAKNSAALKRCISVYTAFVYGLGMTTNSGFWKMPVNIYGLRVDQFLRRIIGEFAAHKGFAFKVIYNGALEPTGFVPLDFECVRLTEPDDMGRVSKVKVCKDWTAKRIDAKKDIKEYDVFNPNFDVVLAQLEGAGGIDKWNGQVFYYGENGEVRYPHSMFHDVLEDTLSDIAIKKGKNANVHTNFMGSHLLQLPFTFAEMVDQINKTNPDARTSAEILRSEFVENLKKFQSAENQGKIMMLENPLKDLNGNMIPFQLDKFEIQDYDKIFELTEKTIKDNIRGSYQQPAMLHEPVATGFSTEIMQSYYNYYNIITAKDRQIFEEVFMTIFSNWRGSNASNDYSIKPLTYI